MLVFSSRFILGFDDVIIFLVVGDVSSACVHRGGAHRDRVCVLMMIGARICSCI